MTKYLLTPWVVLQFPQEFIHIINSFNLMSTCAPITSYFISAPIPIEEIRKSINLFLSINITEPIGHANLYLSIFIFWSVSDLVIGVKTETQSNFIFGLSGQMAVVSSSLSEKRVLSPCLTSSSSHFYFLFFIPVSYICNKSIRIFCSSTDHMSVNHCSLQQHH